MDCGVDEGHASCCGVNLGFAGFDFGFVLGFDFGFGFVLEFFCRKPGRSKLLSFRELWS